MKRVIELCIIIALLLKACVIREKIPVVEKDYIEQAFARGWVKGARYIDSCHRHTVNKLSITNELAQLRLYRDSIEFAKYLTTIKLTPKNEKSK